MRDGNGKHSVVWRKASVGTTHRQLALPILIAALAGCSSSQPELRSAAGLITPPQEFLGAMVADEPRAAYVGREILASGGNAVDAAIATNAVLGLVEPHYNGIGGDAFAIYYEAKTGKLYGLNAGGWAPTGLTPELLRSKGNTGMPGSGIYSVTVPGAVKGWEMLRARFGKLPMTDLLAPAIFYAEDGFPVSDVIANAWNGSQRKLQSGPHAAPVAGSPGTRR